MCRAMELPKLEPQHICADYFEGLIHVIPSYRATDDAAIIAFRGSSIELTTIVFEVVMEVYFLIAL